MNVFENFPLSLYKIQVLLRYYRQAASTEVHFQVVSAPLLLGGSPATSYLGYVLSTLEEAKVPLPLRHLRRFLKLCAMVFPGLWAHLLSAAPFILRQDGELPGAGPADVK